MTNKLSRLQFLQLWDKCVEYPHYDRQVWIDFEYQLLEAGLLQLPTTDGKYDYTIDPTTLIVDDHSDQISTSDRKDPNSLG